MNPRHIIGLEFSSLDVFDEEQAIFYIKSLVSGRQMLLKCKSQSDMTDWLFTLRMSKLCKTEEDLRVDENYKDVLKSFSSESPQKPRASPPGPRHRSDSALESMENEHQVINKVAARDMLRMYVERSEEKKSGNIRLVLLSTSRIKCQVPNMFKWEKVLIELYGKKQIHLTIFN